MVAGAPWVKRLHSPSPDGLTTVLYHGFFFAGESKLRARERLRRQLHWLRSAYTPLTLDQFNEAVITRHFPPRSLLVTADDAKLDLLEVHEEFRAFDLPLAVFVCAGWTAQANEPGADDLLARVVATLEWYAGPDMSLTLGKELRTVMIGRSHRSATIDQILGSPCYYKPHLEELLACLTRLAGEIRPRKICSWSELASLGARGVQFGSHSVSHIRLAPASNMRVRFEVYEAKRLIDQLLAPCTSFAYPFGDHGTSNERTTAVLRAAGMTSAHMTHAGFATNTTPAFHLPRFALPERHMPNAEFRGRVRGGGVGLHRLKNALQSITPLIPARRNNRGQTHATDFSAL
jgi:peptidoglycan/xylan/chitin deacetylase (PgdA/CDA1 family)